jgi:diguanylate cyclase (GGDEF)-like protein
MALDVRARIFGAYVVVLTLGALLATLVFLFGEEVGRATRTLTERDLPELKAIASLKLDLVRHDALLNRYYATRERERFLAERARVDSACVGGLARLAGPLARHAGFERARLGYAALQETTLALDRALGSPVVTGSARRLLEEAHEHTRAIHSELDVLVAEIEARVEASASATAAGIPRMRWRVALLAASIFAVSLFVGYYINAYISEQRERRRLVLFPERNPNPVLELDAHGAVLYANPAARSLLGHLAPRDAKPQALLPPDIRERLEAIKRAAHPRDLWEYRFTGRTFECGAHWIPDLGVFHLYLSDISARKQAEERLVHQAYHDALTALPNRRMFQEQIEAILYAPNRAGMRAAVLLMGLDRFKVIIDSLGHEAGDGLLVAVTGRLGDTLVNCRGLCGATTLYRFEGDRFCVLLPGFRTNEIPVLLAERIVEAMREPFYVNQRELHTTLSIGIVVFPLDGQDGATLLKNADTAMHRAKQLGGNALQCYTRDMNDRAAEWLALENHLRHAEELSELRLYYQPQVSADGGRTVGAEALIRWQHPDHGLISPGQFIPLAEETGLIAPIGTWTLRTACADARAWLDRGLEAVTVAVNISAGQFHRQDLPELVSSALRESGLPPARLELEITEGVAMQDVERTVAILRELKGLGVSLSVDDFGTGFSSLSYLQRFPIDKLKIDQSFVRGLAAGTSNAAIVQAIIALGHSLRLKVIAEGVETREQFALLRGWGCDECQGNFFSAPVPPEKFLAQLRAGARTGTLDS